MADSEIDPLNEAVYETASNFHGRTGKGQTGLAKAVGINPSTFQSKVSKTEGYAHLSPVELRSTMVAADDFRALKQLNMDCGFVAVPVPHVECPADMDLVNAHLDLVGELGEACDEMKRALNDKRLTYDERIDVEKEFYDVVEKIYSLLDVLKGMSEPEDNITSINKVKR